MPEVQRHPEVRAYRATVPRHYLPTVVQRLRIAFGERLDHIVAFPLGGIVRVVVRELVTDGSGDEGALETFCGAIDTETPGADVAVEMGSASDLIAADARRDPATRRVEAMVVEAMGGGPRNWRGDYL